MSFAISEFRGELTYGGQRSTLFDVQLTFPPLIGQAAGRKFSFTCQATETPDSTVGVIPVAYKGRRIPYAGDRQFGSWQVNVLNDEDWVVRNAFEDWSNMINARERNIRQTGTSHASHYKAKGIVKQYSRVNDSTPIRYYEFVDVWPSNVGGMSLNWGELDGIQSFSVRFEYTWWDKAGSSVAGQFAAS